MQGCPLRLFGGRGDRKPFHLQVDWPINYSESLNQVSSISTAFGENGFNLSNLSAHNSWRKPEATIAVAWFQSSLCLRDGIEAMTKSNTPGVNWPMRSRQGQRTPATGT